MAFIRYVFTVQWYYLLLHGLFYLYLSCLIIVARAFLKECSGENKDAVSSIAFANTSTDSINAKYQHVNVLVTSGSLIPSLVKCLLFRLDSLISHGNGKYCFLFCIHSMSCNIHSMSCNILLCQTSLSFLNLKTSTHLNNEQKSLVLTPDLDSWVNVTCHC